MLSKFTDIAIILYCINKDLTVNVYVSISFGAILYTEILKHLSLVMRNPVFKVSDRIKYKSGFTSSGDV